MKNISLSQLEKFSILLVFFISTMFCQTDKILAKIGDLKVTEKEFKNRFELSPRVSKSGDLEKEKMEFLLTLIAEKFLSQEAVNRGYENEEEYTIKLKSLMKKYVRDKLFQKEISDKVKVSKNDLLGGINKGSKTLFCKFILSSDKNEIEKLYKELKHKSITEILVGRPELNEQSEPIKVEYGQSNETLENELFSLKPGEYSKPIYTQAGWVIYYIENIEIKHPDLTDSKFVKKIKDVIKDRKLAESYKSYFDKNIRKLKVDVDIKLFNLLSDRLYTEIKSIEGSDTAKMISPEYRTVQAIKQNLNKSKLQSKFVKFKQNPVSLNDFIDELSAEEIKLEISDLLTLKKSLDRYIKDFIKFEHIFRNAYKKGYALDSEVVEILKIWKENYLASMMRSDIVNKLKKSKNVKSKQENERLYEDFLIDIAKLSTNYEIKIYDKSLKKVNVNPVNIIVYKHFGFGGRGLAVPYTTMNYKWFEISRNLHPDK